jgi:uncharacterized SAM-binding protein YcdF (DUF218 family)
MKPRSKKLIRWSAAISLLLAACLALAWRPILEGMADFLIVSDSLEKADAIAILRGHEVNRCPAAAELYLTGWAPRILITREAIPYAQVELRQYGISMLESHEAALEILKQSKVPAEALTFVDGFNESTAEEANRLKSYMLESGYKSLIVVTSNYHTRRTRLLFRRLFAAAGLEVIVRPAPPSWKFDPHEWWTRRFHQKVLLEEYEKLAYYFFRYW